MIVTRRLIVFVALGLDRLMYSKTLAMQQVQLITNGDLRLEANQKAWPTQARTEEILTDVLESYGVQTTRAFPVDNSKQHGFIDSQKHGMEVFRTIDPDVPLVVLLTTWQYSHHILHGLMTHRAPILTVGNWSGAYPGLVGLLNLNASMTKAGIPYSTTWTEAFDDDFFLDCIRQWVESGSVQHDRSHVRPFSSVDWDEKEISRGRALGNALMERKAILGVFDEGCMGMYNAIVPDALLNRTGLFKERLSQSALYHETSNVADIEAISALQWLRERGVRFETGEDESTELTERQLLLQLKMYIAAVRLADDFGCDAIGIQYQQGLKDLLPASDLAEGLLNNVERPPVTSRDGTRILYPDSALPHFNEVDECAGIDALVTNRIWTDMGFDPATTLHDVRWGELYRDEFVWVFEISGAAPASHFVGGYAGASSMRQLPMYFRLGGGTLRGISRPGTIVWSRVFLESNRLMADVGIGKVVELPLEETERRWNATSREWPIMHAVLDGVTRDQMMARHKSNHVQVAYVPSPEDGLRALTAKAAFFETIGIDVFVCGAK